ncbi:MAG: hypothetical protein ACE5HS_13795 [bacterium]
MSSNGKFQDPYCNKNFWSQQLSPKSYAELEACFADFDQFAAEMENEFRIVMSASRREICREALLELLKSAARQAHNTNQGELFG